MSSTSVSVSSGPPFVDPESRRTTLVLVTGSRTWARPEHVWGRLDALRAGHGHLTVIHGAATQGVDLFAHIWAYYYEHVYPPQAREWSWPADWSHLGRRAGMIRNDEMARVGADYCLAWIQQCFLPNCRRPGVHGTHGASDCVARARAYGVPIVESVEAWAQEVVPNPRLL